MGLSVVGGVTQIGQYQVVVMNRGSNNGLSVGDVLTVWQTGEVINDRFRGGAVRLPDEEAGTEASQAIHVLDTVRNPT